MRREIQSYATQMIAQKTANDGNHESKHLIIVIKATDSTLYTAKIKIVEQCTEF